MGLTSTDGIFGEHSVAADLDLLVTRKEQTPASIIGILDRLVHLLGEGLQLSGCLLGHFQADTVRFKAGDQIGVAVVEPGEALKRLLPPYRRVRVPDTLREDFQVPDLPLNVFNGELLRTTLRIQDDGNVGMVCVDSAKNVTVADSQCGEASHFLGDFPHAVGKDSPHLHGVY
jgi:hypothetical protein